ncbi:MAG: DUF1801 domain-containing protein [Gemmatimonadaceae bacterium]|nr:DUF1801 domain-containing protein [Gemmatimonadaceae bacterium]
MKRPIHPDFKRLLNAKDDALVALFADLRQFVLTLAPESNELLYHTHALTAVFSLSERLSDAFCMLPIYTKHVNLGFNKGTLIADPHRLLQGTGKLIRHVPVETPSSYRNTKVESLVRAAHVFAQRDLDAPQTTRGQTISRITT